MKRQTLTWLTMMIVVVIGTSSLQGAGGSVNAAGQGEVFRKVLAYDRTFKRAQTIHVFIVGAAKGDGEVEALADGFRKAGIHPTIIWENETIELRPNDQIVVVSREGGVHTDESWSLRSSVVYFLPGIEVAAIKQFCTDAGVLSISGTPSFAEAGDVSVSTDPEASGSQIVVNLSRMREEKHELSADLLRIARVVR